jgi:hypothetical protein
VLLDGIDTVDQLSQKLAERRFVEATPLEQTEVLRAFEESDSLDAFPMVRDLTYEAYYAHPRVLDVLERETGWRYEVAISGGELEPFDESLLARIRTLPPRWRKA